MAESTNSTFTEVSQPLTSGLQGSNNTGTQGKQQSRKGVTKAKQHLRSARVSEVDKQSTYETIMVVAASASNLESPRFPLYKPFTLSSESADVFIKVDKNTIVDLSTQERFAAEGFGYYVTYHLVRKGGK